MRLLNKKTNMDNSIFIGAVWKKSYVDKVTGETKPYITLAIELDEKKYDLVGFKNKSREEKEGEEKDKAPIYWLKLSEKRPQQKQQFNDNLSDGI